MPKLKPQKNQDGTYTIGPANSSFGRQVVIVNPDDSHYPHKYVFWFGQIGTTYALVYERCEDDALSRALDWASAKYALADAPRSLKEDYYFHEDGCWFASHEFGLILEPRNRKQLAEFCYPPDIDWK